MIDEVIIKPVPGYPGYYACPNGEIWKINRKYRPPRLMKAPLFRGPHKTFSRDGITVYPGLGYAYVSHNRRVCLAHRLVALAYCQKPRIRSKLQVDHIDGDKGNNNYLNLEWVTCRENHLRRWKLKKELS